MQSSGLAYGQPLTWFVSLRKTRIIQAHALFTDIYLLKRLLVGFWVSCRASPFGAAPVFSFFASIASLPWHTAFSRFALVVNLGLPILASVANRAVKPTCLRQAAYFRSLACLLFLLISAHEYSNAIYPRKRLSAGFFVVCWASPWGAAPVSSLFGL